MLKRPLQPAEYERPQHGRESLYFLVKSGEMVDVDFSLSKKFDKTTTKESGFFN